MSWFTDFDNGRLHMMLGCKGSGKTYSVLAAMREAIKQNAYDAYYCIIPAFRNEEHGSYSWMNMYPNKIFIAEDWNPQLLVDLVAQQDKWSKRIYNEADPRKRAKLEDDMPRIFVFIDDATNFGEEMTRDSTFTHLVTMLRHYKVNMFVCVHSLLAIVRPAIRNNVDRLTIGKLTNNNLLEDVYTAYMSLKTTNLWDQPTTSKRGRLNAFVTWFIENINESANFNMLTISLRSEEYLKDKPTITTTAELPFIKAFTAEIPALNERYAKYRLTMKKKQSATKRKIAEAKKKDAEQIEDDSDDDDVFNKTGKYVRR